MLDVRYGIKWILVGLCVLVTGPLSVVSALAYRYLGIEAVFDFSAKLLSVVPGLPGQYLRASFYVVTLEECPADIAVAFGSFFSHPAVIVGRRVSIGAYSIIGTALIESDALIASRVSIPSGRHQHGDGSHAMEGSDLVASARLARVRVGQGAWIGEGAIVMESVGRRAVVGAGSVVTKPVPDGVVVAGNPARAINGRDKSDSPLLQKTGTPRTDYRQ
jgi:acetyltransferase-like isoleucine patch superfamily enzyme